jgi:hypothetical protein
LEWLCHWAFDAGMISVSVAYNVITSRQISLNPNVPGLLLTLTGRGIIPPSDRELWPAQQYLAEHRRELDQFLDSSRVEILDIDEETADFYAEVFRALKEKWRPIPSNDLWIAAATLRHGLALATLDEHFRHIDGLLLAAI